MCMIVAKAAGVKYPPLEHLTVSEQKNSDGIGIAYGNGKDVIIKKDFKDATECYSWLLANVPDTFGVVIHQRAGTAGLLDAGNRHPFPVTNDCEKMREPNQKCALAMAHNGVFTEVLKHDKYSDTMVFIKEYVYGLSEKKLYSDCVEQRLLLRAIGFSRVCFINKAGQIHLYGGFNQHENGCYYSNKDYQYVKPVSFLRKMDYARGGYASYAYQSQVYKKKINVCDSCHKKVKSKYRKDYFMYLCADCFREYEIKPKSPVGFEKKCDVCAVYSPQVIYYSDLKGNFCKVCHDNERWFRKEINNAHMGGVI